jgi:hypothetical protein
MQKIRWASWRNHADPLESIGYRSGAAKSFVSAVMLHGVFGLGVSEISLDRSYFMFEDLLDPLGCIMLFRNVWNRSFNDTASQPNGLPLLPAADRKTHEPLQA